MFGIKHSTVVATPDDPAFDVGTDEWNDPHNLTDLAFGRGVTAGGVVYNCLPGVVITATSSFGLVVNSIRYGMCWTPTKVTIDQLAFRVTGAGPASNAKVRLGVYAADLDFQPNGDPLADVEVDVASGFTGSKVAAVSAEVMGRFLIAMNCDVTMSVTSFRGGSILGFISDAVSGPGIGNTVVASAYGALPAPGLAWTGVAGTQLDWLAICRVGTP